MDPSSLPFALVRARKAKYDFVSLIVSLLGLLRICDFIATLSLFHHIDLSSSVDCSSTSSWFGAAWLRTWHWGTPSAAWPSTSGWSCPPPPRWPPACPGPTCDCDQAPAWKGWTSADSGWRWVARAGVEVGEGGRVDDNWEPVDGDWGRLVNIARVANTLQVCLCLCETLMTVWYCLLSWECVWKQRG